MVHQFCSNSASSRQKQILSAYFSGDLCAWLISRPYKEKLRLKVNHERTVRHQIKFHYNQGNEYGASEIVKLIILANRSQYDKECIAIDSTRSSRIVWTIYLRTFNYTTQMWNDVIFYYDNPRKSQNINRSIKESLNESTREFWEGSSSMKLPESVQTWLIGHGMIRKDDGRFQLNHLE